MDVIVHNLADKDCADFRRGMSARVDVSMSTIYIHIAGWLVAGLIP